MRRAQAGRGATGSAAPGLPTASTPPPRPSRLTFDQAWADARQLIDLLERSIRIRTPPWRQGGVPARGSGASSLLAFRRYRPPRLPAAARRFMARCTMATRTWNEMRSRGNAAPDALPSRWRSPREASTCSGSDLSQLEGTRGYRLVGSMVNPSDACSSVCAKLSAVENRSHGLIQSTRAARSRALLTS